jgi:hypothetical protein
MMRKKVFFIFTCFLIFFRDAYSYAHDICPYNIDGYVSLSPKMNEFKYAGMNITFYNKCNKNIESVILNIFLYDENGDPPFPEKNCITVNYTQEVKAYGTADFCVSLDEYIAVIPEEPYQTDYIYAAGIEYEDGTEWNDPYGLYAVQ